MRDQIEKIYLDDVMLKFNGQFFINKSADQTDSDAEEVVQAFNMLLVNL